MKTERNGPKRARTVTKHQSMLSRERSYRRVSRVEANLGMSSRRHANKVSSHEGLDAALDGYSSLDVREQKVEGDDVCLATFGGFSGGDGARAAEEGGSRGKVGPSK
mmetsp:Transcript_13444/g.26185  ORF Transcript_13444/g.26185 Transcript_13444/m.26185 type:complete len:107 (+) Transcript_13444:118-438(+)